LEGLTHIAKLLDCETSDFPEISPFDVNEKALALLNYMDNLCEAQKTILLDLLVRLDWLRVTTWRYFAGI